MAARDQRQVIVVADPPALAKAAADRILARIAANPGRIAICLTGGSSPKKLYELLGTEAYRSHIQGSQLKLFPQCGHLPMFEREAEFVKAIADFCES